jgi:hypothetical protein
MQSFPCDGRQYYPTAAIFNLTPAAAPAAAGAPAFTAPGRRRGHLFFSENGAAWHRDSPGAQRPWRLLWRRSSHPRKRRIPRCPGWCTWRGCCTRWDPATVHAGQSCRHERTAVGSRRSFFSGSVPPKPGSANGTWAARRVAPASGAKNAGVARPSRPVDNIDVRVQLGELQLGIMGGAECCFTRPTSRASLPLPRPAAPRGWSAWVSKCALPPEPDPRAAHWPNPIRRCNIRHSRSFCNCRKPFLPMRNRRDGARTTPQIAAVAHGRLTRASSLASQTV